MKINETHGLTEFNEVFEIPIYRLSNSKFETELKNLVNKSIPFTKEEMIKIHKEKGTYLYDEIRNHSKSVLEYNWKFNEIIGWITLHLNHGIIFGEIFLKKTNRITRSSKAKISFHDCGFKIPYDPKSSNAEIFQDIMNSITEIQTSKKFKNRYIDKSNFETTGPFIDWKKLYESLNK